MNIIDSRKGGSRSADRNRKKFLRRNKKAIKKAVQDAIQDSTIADVGKGEVDVNLGRGTDEPMFNHRPGTGVTDQVHPGNDRFTSGDQVPRPQGGQGQGPGQAGNSGEGEDEFVFRLSSEEFMDYFMEDLALPNLAKKQLSVIESFKKQKAGFSNEGSPGSLSINRTFKNAVGRRIGQAAAVRKQIKELEAKDPRTEEEEKKLLFLRKKIRNLRFIDDLDIRYVRTETIPETKVNAVMFCLMDVSYSMDEERKDLAKRFYVLLHMFLQRFYNKVDVVFVRHTHVASEVSEQEFFHGKETGGTVVSTGVDLIRKIIDERYPENAWNMYCAQASDGDNFENDENALRESLHKLIPKLQYYAYIDILANKYFGMSGEPSELWGYYDEFSDQYDHFERAAIQGSEDIWPVFRALFKKGEK